MVGHETNTIDLLFSDVVMPQMNGIELAHQLMDPRPGIKIILTSGYTEPDVSQAIPKAVFIPKPFLPAMLATKVREALDRRSGYDTGAATNGMDSASRANDTMRE